MFPNIPIKRALLYIMLGGLIPVFFAILTVIAENRTASELRSSLQEMQQMAMIREKKQATNMAVRNHYRDADHFYIDKHLETLTFLEPEIESLQKILSNPNVAEDETAKKRLEFLTGPSNSMSFSEGVVQSAPFFQETTETLVHPVEINASDLQKILTKVEGVGIGAYKPDTNRPQLIILDFKLDRKTIAEKNEIFTLNLKLLKREFL